MFAFVMFKVETTKLKSTHLITPPRLQSFTLRTIKASEVQLSLQNAVANFPSTFKQRQHPVSTIDAFNTSNNIRPLIDLPRPIPSHNHRPHLVHVYNLGVGVDSGAARKGLTPVKHNYHVLLFFLDREKVSGLR